MDMLARQNLWRAGLDFKHGTGHGVGTYLNVHEGPQGISRYSYVELKEGMCVSDEPGYYQDGEFGIRIENVIAVQKHPKNPDFFCWKNFTTAPYCRELINPQLLSEEHIRHINEFHKRCLKELKPHLKDDKRALEYVKRQCEPIAV
jgi:Xaa-Pro aminopeptidase